MTQTLLDHRSGIALIVQHRGVGLSQIMDPDFGQSSGFTGRNENSTPKITVFHLLAPRSNEERLVTISAGSSSGPKVIVYQGDFL